MPGETEGVVQSQVLAYLNRAGYFCMSDADSRRKTPPVGCPGVYWRQNTGGMKTADGFVKFGVKGCPDLLGVLRGGRLFGIELKRLKGGVQSPEQQWFAACLEFVGGLYVLANSVAVVEAAFPPVAVQPRPSGRVYPR